MEKKINPFIKRKEVKVKNRWKTSDIYKSVEDWKIDKDKVLKEINNISKLTSNWTSNSKNMLKTLRYLENIRKKLSKLSVYTSLNLDVDIQNSDFILMKGIIQDIYIKYNSKTSFLKTDILFLGKTTIKKYMKEETELKDFDLLFDQIFNLKNHILSAEIEDIIALSNLFSSSSENIFKSLNNLELPSKSIKLSDDYEIKLNSINYTKYRYSKKRNDRKKVMKEFLKNRGNFRNTFAEALDGTIKSHYFYSKCRKYQTCLEAELKPKKIDVSVYKNLIETVKNNRKSIFEFFKIKKKLLGIKSLHYYDLYASSVPKYDKTFTFQEGKKLILDAMQILGPEYIKILKIAFKNRWIDIYPNLGKRVGAYSNGGAYGIHPYVLLNFDNTFKSVNTLAHELGHALHSWFSSHNNPYSKSRYVIFLAEIASTFNEMILSDYMLKSAKDNKFKIFLIDKILEKYRTTFLRQTIFADFELQMHEFVEKGNKLTAKWLDTKYLELIKYYYGHNEGIVEIDEFVKNEWSFIHHFHYGYYVYQYATGLSASTVLSEKVINGNKNDIYQYHTFLKSGGNDYPINILKKAGVDLSTPDPILKTLNKISEFSETLKQLSK